MWIWAKDLRAAWRTESIVLSSPMPIEVARGWLFGGQAGGNRDVVRRAGANLNTRTAWRPVLRGRLLPIESGSTFVGILGWDPGLRFRTCCLLGTSAALFAIGAATLTLSLFTGESHPVGVFLVCLGGFGAFTLTAGIVAGYRETQGQLSYLRSWITGQMNVPWYQESRTIDD